MRVIGGTWPQIIYRNEKLWLHHFTDLYKLTEQYTSQFILLPWQENIAVVTPVTYAALLLFFVGKYYIRISLYNNESRNNSSPWSVYVLVDKRL